MSNSLSNNYYYNNPYTLYSSQSQPASEESKKALFFQEVNDWVKEASPGELRDIAAMYIKDAYQNKISHLTLQGLGLKSLPNLSKLFELCKENNHHEFSMYVDISHEENGGSILNNLKNMPALDLDIKIKFYDKREDGVWDISACVKKLSGTNSQWQHDNNAQSLINPSIEYPAILGKLNSATSAHSEQAIPASEQTSSDTTHTSTSLPQTFIYRSDVTLPSSEQPTISPHTQSYSQTNQNSLVQQIPTLVNRHNTPIQQSNLTAFNQKTALENAKQMLSSDANQGIRSSFNKIVAYDFLATMKTNPINNSAFEWRYSIDDRGNIDDIGAVEIEIEDGRPIFSNRDGLFPNALNNIEIFEQANNVKDFYEVMTDLNNKGVDFGFSLMWLHQTLTQSATATDQAQVIAQLNEIKNVETAALYQTILNNMVAENGPSLTNQDRLSIQQKLLKSSGLNISASYQTTLNPVSQIDLNNQAFKKFTQTLTDKIPVGQAALYSIDFSSAYQPGTTNAPMAFFRPDQESILVFDSNDGAKLLPIEQLSHFLIAHYGLDGISRIAQSQNITVIAKQSNHEEEKSTPAVLALTPVASTTTQTLTQDATGQLQSLLNTTAVENIYPGFALTSTHKNYVIQVLENQRKVLYRTLYALAKKEVWEGKNKTHFDKIFHADNKSLKAEDYDWYKKYVTDTVIRMIKLNEGLLADKTKLDQFLEYDKETTIGNSAITTVGTISPIALDQTPDSKFLFGERFFPNSAYYGDGQSPQPTIEQRIGSLCYAMACLQDIALIPSNGLQKNQRVSPTKIDPNQLWQFSNSEKGQLIDLTSKVGFHTTSDPYSLAYFCYEYALNTMDNPTEEEVAQFLEKTYGEKYKHTIRNLPESAQHRASQNKTHTVADLYNGTILEKPSQFQPVITKLDQGNATPTTSSPQESDQEKIRHARLTRYSQSANSQKPPLNNAIPAPSNQQSSDLESMRTAWLEKFGTTNNIAKPKTQEATLNNTVVTTSNQQSSNVEQAQLNNFISQQNNIANHQTALETLPPIQNAQQVERSNPNQALARQLVQSQAATPSAATNSEMKTFGLDSNLTSLHSRHIETILRKQETTLMQALYALSRKNPKDVELFTKMFHLEELRAKQDFAWCVNHMLKTIWNMLELNRKTTPQHFGYLPEDEYFYQYTDANNIKSRLPVIYVIDHPNKKFLLSEVFFNDDRHILDNSEYDTQITQGVASLSYAMARVENIAQPASQYGHKLGNALHPNGYIRVTDPWNFCDRFENELLEETSPRLKFHALKNPANIAYYLFRHRNNDIISQAEQSSFGDFVNDVNRQMEERGVSPRH